MLNVLSVDVEDYFQVEAFAEKIHRDDWDSYERRVELNTCRILEMFAKFGAKGTFFILGWVADRLPHLSKQIASAGHEIGCHGYAHQRLQTLTRDQFREDLKRATGLLTDQVQQPVRSYRAPSFSIVRHTMWAFDVLAEEGYTFDSSIFPVRHDFYGVPDAERFPSWQTSPAGHRIFEFPPCRRRVPAADTLWSHASGGPLYQPRRTTTGNGVLPSVGDRPRSAGRRSRASVNTPPLHESQNHGSQDRTAAAGLSIHNSLECLFAPSGISCRAGTGFRCNRVASRRGEGKKRNSGSIRR